MSGLLIEHHFYVPFGQSCETRYAIRNNLRGYNNGIVAKWFLYSRTFFWNVLYKLPSSTCPRFYLLAWTAFVLMIVWPIFKCYVMSCMLSFSVISEPVYVFACPISQCILLSHLISCHVLSFSVIVCSYCCVWSCHVMSYLISYHVSCVLLCYASPYLL